jgi:hypothetical protein
MERSLGTTFHVIQKMVFLFCLMLLSFSGWAVPVIGNFAGTGGLTVPIGNTGGTATTGRLPTQNPGSNILAVRNTLGLVATDLSGLPGGPYTHASALYSDISLTSGEDIVFSALALPLNLIVLGTPAGPPRYNYFASLDPTGLTPGTDQVRTLALTASNQAFSLVDLFGPVATGSYRFGLGAVRTNPGTSFVGTLLNTYGTSIVVSNVRGTPEIDPGSAAAPLALLLGGVLLASDVRRRSSPFRA